MPRKAGLLKRTYSLLWLLFSHLFKAAGRIPGSDRLEIFFSFPNSSLSAFCTLSQKKKQITYFFFRNGQEVLLKGFKSFVGCPGKEQLVVNTFKIHSRWAGIRRQDFLCEAQDLQVILDFLNTCFCGAACRQQLLKGNSSFRCRCVTFVCP